uniref:Protein kinase domain-containing protein n=1 Tax=Rhabditophanes sp. KR3021 TaxID=114890 RepID=A0AC35TW98_9BILA
MTELVESRGYKLIRSIGKGGFAECYAAVRNKDKKDVAIKIIKKERQNKKLIDAELKAHKTFKHSCFVEYYDDFGDKEVHCIVMELCSHGSLKEHIRTNGKLREDQAKSVLEKLIRAIKKEKQNKKLIDAELKAHKTFKHSCFVEYYDDFGDREVHCIVMELCSHGSLKEHIRTNGKLREDQAKSVLEKLIRAVSILNDNNVMHRDLSTGNILISRWMKGGDLVVKLADFGLVKFMDASKNCNTIAGTPHFIAREVMDGEYDKKADVFSLGCVLFAMLTAKPPPIDEGNDILRIVKRASLSTDATDLLLKMLDKKERRIELKHILKEPFICGCGRLSEVVSARRRSASREEGNNGHKSVTSIRSVTRPPIEKNSDILNIIENGTSVESMMSTRKPRSIRKSNGLSSGYVSNATDCTKVTIASKLRREKMTWPLPLFSLTNIVIAVGKQKFTVEMRDDDCLLQCEFGNQNDELIGAMIVKQRIRHSKTTQTIEFYNLKKSNCDQSFNEFVHLEEKWLKDPTVFKNLDGLKCSGRPLTAYKIVHDFVFNMLARVEKARFNNTGGIRGAISRFMANGDIKVTMPDKRVGILKYGETSFKSLENKRCPFNESELYKLRKISHQFEAWEEAGKDHEEVNMEESSCHILDDDSYSVKRNTSGKIVQIIVQKDKVKKSLRESTGDSNTYVYTKSGSGEHRFVFKGGSMNAVRRDVRLLLSTLLHCQKNDSTKENDALAKENVRFGSTSKTGPINSIKLVGNKFKCATNLRISGSNMNQFVHKDRHGEYKRVNFGENDRLSEVDSFYRPVLKLLLEEMGRSYK